MTTIDTLAIIGALAWIYPLAQWLNDKLLRTELDIIMHKELEVGYSVLGPIINLNIAFSASKDDAFIKDVTIQLTHESNQTELYKWEWFEELIMEVHIPDSAAAVPYKKNQKAIAIKVLVESLAEKKIGFHNPNFQAEYSSLFQKTFEVSQNLTNKSAEISELRKTNEYNDFENLFKNSFTWKVGRYKGEINCSVANRTKVFKRVFEFYLSSVEIRLLETNKQICLDVLENHFIKTEPEYKAFWQWVYPRDIAKTNVT
jgi:hypothetical protein